MPRPPEPASPEARHRATLRLRRITRWVVLAATGAAALVGVAVAEEHPGTASSASTGATRATTATTPTTTPTTTRSRAVVTSGGTS